MNNVIFVLTYFSERRSAITVTVYGQGAVNARLAAAKLAGLVVSVRLADPI